MMEKEKIDRFMVDGIENKISLKEFISFEIIIIFLAIPCIAFGDKRIFIILYILSAAFYLISYIKLRKGKVIEGATYFLHNGIISVCLSFIFAVVGIEVLFYLFSGKKRILVLSIVSIGYFVSQFLYVLKIKRMIAQNTYRNNKMQVRITITLFGILGMIVGKVFLKDLDYDLKTIIFCVSCFFLSYLFSFGIINFVKYRYIMKHPEILDKKKAK